MKLSSILNTPKSLIKSLINNDRLVVRVAGSLLLLGITGALTLGLSPVALGLLFASSTAILAGGSYRSWSRTRKEKDLKNLTSAKGPTGGKFKGVSLKNLRIEKKALKDIGIKLNENDNTLELDQKKLENLGIKDVNLKVNKEGEEKVFEIHFKTQKDFKCMAIVDVKSPKEREKFFNDLIDEKGNYKGKFEGASAEHLKVEENALREMGITIDKDNNNLILDDDKLKLNNFKKAELNINDNKTKYTVDLYNSDEVKCTAIVDMTNEKAKTNLAKLLTKEKNNPYAGAFLGTKSDNLVIKDFSKLKNIGIAIDTESTPPTLKLDKQILSALDIKDVNLNHTLNEGKEDYFIEFTVNNIQSKAHIPKTNKKEITNQANLQQESKDPLKDFEEITNVGEKKQNAYYSPINKRKDNVQSLIKRYNGTNSPLNEDTLSNKPKPKKARSASFRKQ